MTAHVSFLSKFALLTSLLLGCAKHSPPSLLSEWETLEKEEASSLFQHAYQYYQKGELKSAVEGFEKFWKLYPKAPEGDDAAYLLMLCQVRLKNENEVLIWTSRLLQDYPETPYRDLALLFEARIYDQKKKFLEASLRYSELLQSEASNLQKDAEDAFGILIHENLSLADLKVLLERYPFLRPKLLLRIGERELEERKREEGTESLRRLVEEFPESEDAQKARSLLAWGEEKEPRYKIGLLLPTTGEASPFGWAVYRGIELAISDVDSEGTGQFHSKILFETILKDTEGDPIVALARAKELIEREGVLALIGPVLSISTIPVAARANDQGVVLISPTATDERISTIGPYIFQLNPSIRVHGRTMAQFAIEKFGISQFAILYPLDGYGEGMVKVFTEEAEGRGGKIIAREPYPPGTTDFQQMILRIKRTNPEALFIPAHPDEILLIAPQLRFHQIDVTILGGTGWGSEKVLNSEYTEGAFFSFNPLEGEGSEGKGGDFFKRYRQKYGEDPSHSAALGYDAMKILGSTIVNYKKEVDRKILREQLSLLDVYQGVSGILSLTGYASSEGSVWTLLKGKRIRVEEIENLQEEKRKEE